MLEGRSAYANNKKKNLISAAITLLMEVPVHVLQMVLELLYKRSGVYCSGKFLLTSRVDFLVFTLNPMLLMNPNFL
jgi:hypothetical protein